MEIRPARVEDAAPLARVHVATWQAAYEHVFGAERLAAVEAERRVQAWERSLREPAADDAVFVAEVEDAGLVGFASVGSCRDGPDTPAASCTRSTCCRRSGGAVPARRCSRPGRRATRRRLRRGDPVGARGQSAGAPVLRARRLAPRRRPPHRAAPRRRCRSRCATGGRSSLAARRRCRRPRATAAATPSHVFSGGADGDRDRARDHDQQKAERLRLGGDRVAHRPGRPARQRT